MLRTTFFLLFVFVCSGFAQTAKTEPDSGKSINESCNIPEKPFVRDIISSKKINFSTDEQMPYPIGGMGKMIKRLVYPLAAKEKNIEGKVEVNCWISDKGIVERAEVKKGLGYGCDEAALEAAYATKFIPGKVKGKPVNVIITIPFVFRLE